MKTLFLAALAALVALSVSNAYWYSQASDILCTIDQQFIDEGDRTHVLVTSVTDTQQHHFVYLRKSWIVEDRSLPPGYAIIKAYSNVRYANGEPATVIRVGSS